VETCPKCQSHRVHRSHTRTLLEGVRKRFTTNRPQRCEACGWRGWGPDTPQRRLQVNHHIPELRSVDLDALDADVAPLEQPAGATGSKEP
jgi:hypothetical protein